MNVPFCNSNAFRIDNKELKEKVYLECERLFKTTLKRDYFPGPQPVAIEIKDLPKLKENYMICEKTDGERAVLLLINIDNKPMCFIINRNNELYFMDLSFKKEVFEGSIFDGEIIKTKTNVWNYLAHDCLSYNGTSFLTINHRLRYACIIDLIVKRYNPKPTDPFNVKTKLFFNYTNEIDKTWDLIQATTENVIDGLIFTPIDHPVVFGRDYQLFKWKQEHTIDLFVKRENKNVTFYFQKKSEKIVYKTLKSESEKRLIKEFLTPDQLKLGAVVEFKVENQQFIPYRIRTDKNKANSEITIKNTLINIEEAIDISKLKNV
jgi:mRNA guanylyltransferase